MPAFRFSVMRDNFLAKLVECLENTLYWVSGGMMIEDDIAMILFSFSDPASRTETASSIKILIDKWFIKK